ncbi:2CS histidine protein kinase [Bifidobacterium amazonense]|uniref:2CS histidine protein kinase n=1 Tax=Bifidobacterium amazonense TaxID=2809027 RepID=A0ABS9VXJ0_9BIFI|nr:2CS histidine protein kinase [Bifidobacterium amazonense]MCH9276694.1 2CS histidine protein kinase [Bifidobacterium amazonense]
MTAVVGWRRLLADADRRVANAWLLVAVLIVAVACTMETLVALTFDGMTVAGAVCAFVFAAAVIGMAFRPVSGGLAVVALWIVLCFAPVTMPSAALVAVLIAVGVFGYANRRAAVAITVVALTSWLLTAGGVALPQWGSGSGNGSANSLAGSGASPDSGAADSSGSADSDADGSADSGNDDAPTNDSIGGANGGASDESADGGSSGSDARGETSNGGSQNNGGSAQSNGSGGSGDSNGSGSGGESSSDGAGSGGDRHVLLGTVAMSGVAPVVILFAGFLLGGMAARWNHERHAAQMELAYRRQRARAAQDIHDYVSNDLAYLILRFDKDIADGRAPSLAELRELRDVASGALDRTHQVIGVIEGRDDSDPRASTATAVRSGDGGDTAAETSASTASSSSSSASSPSSAGGRNAGRQRSTFAGQPPSHPSVINPSVDRVDCPLAAQLRTIARSGDHRLAELGFDGQTIVSNANDAAQPDDLIAGLLEELYGNIAKHADPACGYVLTIGIGRDAVQIALVDTALVDDGHGIGRDAGQAGRRRQSLGTGLDRYRTRLNARGGALDIDARHGEWTLSAVIPLPQ